MHIKRLELKNFRGFAKASVDFPEGNVAVFFGWNGAGKTAVLDAVGMILDQAITHKSPLGKDDILLGQYGVAVSSEIDYLGKTMSLASAINISYSEKRPAVKELPQNLLKEKWPTDVEFPLMAYYRTNREVGYQKTNNFRRMKSANGRDAAYWNAINVAVTDFFEFIQWFRQEEDFENQQKIERRDFNWENPSLKSIRRSLLAFLSKMDADFSDLKVQRQSNGAMDFSKPSQNSELYIQKAGQELKLSQLSSGERSLILLVADIARRASILNPQLPDPLQSTGIVLIDEIELHLHPKWQRAVIPALRTTFPNIQFIIATHSPQVLSEVENGAVFEIDNFQIRPRHTYGRDNDWVLHVIMEDEERPKKVQEMLERYFELIRTDQLVEAARLRQQIEEEIDPDEPELVKADILLRRKERAVAS